jgi:histidinol phosphatase-like enzyme (inositol monophosphatase family)
MPNDIKTFIKFANYFADQSRNILKKKFLKSLKIEQKNDGSFVTSIDKEIESKFRDLLKKTFPSHGVVGEEFGFENENNEYVWVIDPLDGTHNFIAGKPLFGTLICCMKNGVPFIGIVEVPILENRWYGGKGLGVKFNGKSCIFKKKQKKFNNLIVASTSLLMFDPAYEKKVKDIYKNIGFPVFGSDCYSYGLMLLGKIDLIIEANMKPWDYLAQVSLINEYGGIITDWKGEQLSLKSSGKIIASLEKNHHKKIIEHLNK